jgi:hypothetical protein
MAEPNFDLIGDWYTDDFEMNLEEDTLWTGTLGTAAP